MVNCRTEPFEDPGILSENKDDELHILKILDDSELIDATLTNWKWTSKYDIGGWVKST